MPFNPLDYPLAFCAPEYISDASAWVEHIPFGMALVQMACPRTLVELGTHKGDSYMAFCQAIVALNRQHDTRCHAVDTWRGDSHAGSYQEDVLAALRREHDPRYSAFSELVPATFDHAAERFADGTIDLLHIDGLHTYEAVSHDLARWRPKLSDAAVVLFHDTAERQADFGVWKLWEEVSPRHPSFEFLHGHGLGVLAIGRRVPGAVLQFLSVAQAEPDRVRAYFAQAGAALEYRRLVRGALVHLHRQQCSVHDWKRRVGLPVDPAYEQLDFAFVDPLAYVRHTCQEVQALIDEVLCRPIN